MPITWNVYLVTLSVLIGMFGSFSALMHTDNMRISTGKVAQIWMTAGAVNLGVAIWSMHFIGMLAFHLPIAMTYDIQLTVLSIFPAIVATLFGFYLLQNRTVRFGRVAVAGTFMGLGVAAMHYTGMAALKMQPAIDYDPLIFSLSIVIAIVASIGALLIVFVGDKTGLSSLKQQTFGGLVMGIAIAGMHYTAMHGTSFAAGSFCSVGGQTIESTLLALIVTSAVMVLFSGGSIASVINRSVALDRLRAAHATLEEQGKQLRQVEETLSGILSSIPVVVWSISPTYEVLYLNRAAYTVYGYSAAELIANRTLWIDLVHPDDRIPVIEWLEKIYSMEEQTIQYRIVRPNGEVRWLEDNARMVRNEQGTPLRLDGVATDISERRLRDKRIEYLATFDSLTGLPNRNLLMNRLAKSLIQACHGEQKLGLLFLDIDHFKNINDSFGHAFGDRLLKEFASRLKSVLREGDTVARLGGDEFVIILENIKVPENAQRIASKILNKFLEAVFIDGRELHVTTSIGVAVYPQDGDDADTLLKHADVAMYRAKAQGRNSFQCYTLEMGYVAAERISIEHALHHALKNNEFELHYQPQIDLKNGQIKGVEALIRWHNPVLGTVPPMRFIPLAEESGLIIPIGEWVLKTACAQTRIWQQAGYPVSVAVNVSGRQFKKNDMARGVQSVLDCTGLSAAFLEIELTESMLMNDSAATIQILRELKAIGVGLSIDDFGTGFSSLSYLSRFPIDIIKIDQSFISGLTKEPEAASIITAIIALAKSLGLKTLAEGVETAEQLDFLQKNRCDAIQGYYFSRPLPVNEMTALLEQGNRPHLSKIGYTNPHFKIVKN
jgi:diguanylate cyclase (GGDEF)-like protein/PAS domain S-box-containing protein